MKKLIVVLIVLVVLVLGLFLAKNAIAKFAISKGVKATTGLKLGIESIDVGIFTPVVSAKGLTIYNPSNFTARKMAGMPVFYLNYDLGSFLRGGVHLRKLKMNLEKIVIVKNKEGKLNLETLEKIAKKEKAKEAKKEEGKKKEFKIDFLALKIGDVLYKDYSQGESAKVEKFEVNLDQNYKNITDPHSLMSLILVKALANTTISNLIDFDLKPLKENINQISESVQDTAAEVIKEGEDTAKEATDAIKDILPFGQKE
ncbi:MAG: hypothetical protein K9L95_02195 [Candidatus Omnitrophica bacterium]|nr:hypothetical protein [Candidatus Omnitrophota bacterium]MCF7877716.1 hypothetical protein [Candidatus Omnitrophota bacterium]MCF7878266.1 hypothetical protein [Candidatus Omnitrophota bacterium]